MRRLLSVLAIVVLALVVAPSSAAARGGDNAAEIVQIDTSEYPEVEVVLALPQSTGVDDQSLSLTEAGQEVPISVRPVGLAGLKVAIVLDVSSSMDGFALDAAKQSAVAFVEGLPEGASAAVVSFSDVARLDQPFTSNRVDLQLAIEGLQAGGGTAMFDGITAALTALGSPSGTDRAIVVLTDGDDADSAATLDETIARVNAADVQFTGISLVTESGGASQLQPIADAAGGRVFNVDDPSLLVGAYGLVSASLESRYEVAYTALSTEPDNELVFSLDGEPALTQNVSYTVTGIPTAAARIETAAPQLVSAGGLASQPWIPWTGALLIAAGLVGCVLMVQNDSERRALRTATSQLSETPDDLGGMQFDERIDAAEKSTSPADMLSGVAEGLTDAATKVLERRGHSGQLAALIERAGISIRPGELGAFVLTCSLAGLAIGFALGGPIFGLVLLVAPGLLTPTVLKFLAGRRRKKFAGQLGDTLILISGALKAGYGLAQALDSVAAEAPSPTKEEFSRALLETRLGLTLEAALDSMDDRMQCEDFTWVVNAVKINAAVGGDLSKILDQVGDTIRARTKIRRQINALAAEGKISALVLFSLPPGLVFFIAMSNPTYIEPLFSTTTGHFILGAAIVMMGAGGLWLRKLVNPEV